MLSSLFLFIYFMLIFIYISFKFVFISKIFKIKLVNFYNNLSIKFVFTYILTIIQYIKDYFNKQG